MLIKMSEMMWATSEDASKFFAGYQPFVNMTLGGVTRSGADATNDLTYLLMGRPFATSRSTSLPWLAVSTTRAPRSTCARSSTLFAPAWASPLATLTTRTSR